MIPLLRLRHAKVTLALHALRQGEGRPLLLLHALGSRSPRAPESELADWPGPLYALDFTGHGDSTLPVGGGYAAELLMADADAALAHLGRATLLGRGVGAYAALLLCGARPAEVRGAILCDGPGLAGGGPEPGTPQLASLGGLTREVPDPFALLELSRDIRPPAYARSFAAQAASLSGIDHPIRVCATARPPWLAAVLESAAAEPDTLPGALERLAGVQ